MKETVFRGQRADNNEWVQGYQHNPYVNKDFIYSSKTHEYYHVHFDTISRYTGHNDRNGNSIFEGDIVMWTDGRKTIPAIIRWESDGFYVVIRDHPSRKQPMSRTDGNDIAVIGNLWDNPELMKGNGNTRVDAGQ